MLLLYGFDIGGTKIAFSVYDHALNCLFATQVATPSDYASFLSVICEMVTHADQSFACTGMIGIGLPGAINVQNDRIYCANVSALNGQRLIADMSILFGRDIKLENDANCFLLSECTGGAGEGCATVLGITLGTGVGGAIFVNGALHYGKNAFAGEIGHYPIPATLLLKYPDLPRFRCGCGRQMCLETYISGTGLSNLYQYYAQQFLSSPEILNKQQMGERIASKVVDIYLEILAAGLATSILVVDPDALVFGGGLSNLNALSEQLIKRLPKYLLNNTSLPKISKATFGATGGVRGAAILNL